MEGGIKGLTRTFTTVIFFGLVLSSSLLFLAAILINRFVSLEPQIFAVVVASLGLLISVGVATIISRWLVRPLELVLAALGHLKPGDMVVTAPNLSTLRVGREVTEDIISRIYRLAAEEKSPKKTEHDNHWYKELFDLIPAVVVSLNHHGEITYLNGMAARYIDASTGDARGSKFSDVFNLSFGGSTSFESWLAGAHEGKITDSVSWQRVKLVAADSSHFFFDMAAFYSKDQPSGNEVIIVMIDHTARYQKDEDEVSFVSLAVHELRTPVTVLRGYIEVFEQEMGSQMDDELKGFMSKMSVSAAQLALFINNILNVARIENNQMNLNIGEVDWKQFVSQAVESDLALRAEVRNRKITLDLPAEVPHVAADGFAIYEVLSNLVDNAIKYSYDAGEIIVRVSVREDGMVQTTVQDFGIGIPQSVIGHLFEKFYRSHRSKSSVGGTGLGLFLAKTIIEAHRGQIQVESTEGQGAAFSFTLPAYDSVAKDGGDGDNDGIERSSHGWIKNHSMYRR